MNAWETDVAALLQSREVRHITQAIGVAPGETHPGGLRYGKICILADADSDGAHIATLLCALFLRHYRVLVEQRRIYLCQPPLYRIDIGKAVHYAQDEAEKQSLLSDTGRQGPPFCVLRGWVK